MQQRNVEIEQGTVNIENIQIGKPSIYLEYLREDLVFKKKLKVVYLITVVVL